MFVCALVQVTVHYRVLLEFRDWSKGIGGGGVGRSIWKCG